MTFYGLNPSFVFNSPMPLFANLVRRAKRVEADGTVKLMEHTSEAFVDSLGGNCALQRRASGLLTAEPRGPLIDSVTFTPSWPMLWHRPSLEALKALRPAVLRTLDWQMTNKRPDWSLPRVLPTDVLQGTDRGMAVELQAEAANLLKCHLWWCAPPRFELAVTEYEKCLEEMLVAIRDTSTRPPILEYGNELWNAGFAVHGWLKEGVANDAVGHSWQIAAAEEIATLKEVADRVFGAPGPLGARPYYLFVGGQLTVPSHLDKILSALADLGVCPDLAGPALYVTPLKAQMEEWVSSGAVPTQDELRASCFARLAEIVETRSSDAFGDMGRDGVLRQHDIIRRRHGVPYFACYEAGQSLIAGDKPWRKAAIEAQKTEWMGDLYRALRATAEAAGVDLLNFYSAATDQAPTDPRVDVFGLLEGTDLTNLLPKARAARGD